MKIEAIEKATNALDAARNAYFLLREDESFPQSERAWREFLVQADRVYNYLKEGSKGCRKSQPWYGNVQHDLKNDPLLCYLRQSRNADEHSLQDVKPTLTALSILPDTVTEPGLQTISITVGYGYMTPVTNRGTTYDVPKEHQGKPLTDTKLLTAAQLALDYLEGIINDAKRFVT
jgi:hypothetical protein